MKVLIAILLVLVSAQSADAQTHETIGSAPVSKGRVLISEVIASNQATVDFDTVFTSTYDLYQVEIIGVVPVDDDVELYGRVRSGGSYQATNYDTGLYAEGAGSGVGDQLLGDGATQMYILGADGANFGLSNSSVDSGSIVLTVSQATSTAKYVNIWGIGNYVNNTPRAVHNRTHSIWKNAAAVTGIRFLFSSGNVSSGIFRVWGIPKI